MIILRFLLTLIFISTFVFSADLKDFKRIKSDFNAIVVKDLRNNKILISKDENQVLSPASLTKVMTAILAIESGKLNSVVKITPAMKKVDPTISNFRVGEKFYLRDLVHAALIRSSNDAAMAIAIYLGKGSKQNFVSQMNKKAKRLGMRNTKFSNPCGFDIGYHKSSARDLLKLTEYAIRSKTFNSIVQKRKYTFKAINTKRKYSVLTSNKLMMEERNVVGVKTGFTNMAGACLIARAKKGKKDVLMVMLNANNRWENAKAIVRMTLK